jgi:hypothetical protein
MWPGLCPSIPNPSLEILLPRYRRGKSNIHPMQSLRNRNEKALHDELLPWTIHSLMECDGDTLRQNQSALFLLRKSTSCRFFQEEQENKDHGKCCASTALAISGVELFDPYRIQLLVFFTALSAQIFHHHVDHKGICVGISCAIFMRLWSTVRFLTILTLSRMF